MLMETKPILKTISTALLCAMLMVSASFVSTVAKAPVDTCKTCSCPCSKDAKGTCPCNKTQKREKKQARTRKSKKEKTTKTPRKQEKKSKAGVKKAKKVKQPKVKKSTKKVVEQK
jgi:hypothetical protein